MQDTVNCWIGQAWSSLELIPGASSAVSRERLRWGKFHNIDTLEVVVFGAYDAGKSSLLKRLLVDWRIPVPEWLTVSGRRETFESKRVVAKGLGLTDTPGLGSGNNEHDDLTLGAMRLADFYLWVLPPQLVTTGKERFLEVLFGDVGIAEATIAVVARMDEAGVDPSDNEVGFSGLCLKKKQELTSLVATDSPDKKLSSMHCVVADPYQIVGNTTDPEPEIYDLGRSWDGVKDLADEILALREHRSELRRQAGARFVRLLLSDVLDELGRLSEDLTLSKEGMDNEADRHAIYEERLEAMQRQARSDLHLRIEDSLLSVSRSGVTGAESIQSLELTLSKLIDEWAEGSFSQYRQLVGDLELEVRERMTGPSMDGFRRLVQEAEEHEAQATSPRSDPLKTGRRALAFGPALRKAFEKYAASELGMTIKEAADRLKKLESSGETVEKLIKSQGPRATFHGAEQLKKASQFVKWGSVLDAVGPLVEELGSALLDVAGEVMTAKRAEERAQQRLELRRQLRDEAQKLEESVAADFDSTCDGIRQWLSERLTAIQSGQAGLAEQLEQLNKSVTSLNDLITAYPLN
jgi:hypothetical protein